VKFVVGVLAAVLLLAGCSSSGTGSAHGSSGCGGAGLSDNPGAGKYCGVGMVPPQPRPSFTLADTTGASFNFSTGTANRATLLFFGYTTCPDVCPETMADIGLALKSLPAATQKKVDVVFVSTDVKHDTGPVIAAWLKNFSAGSSATFIGLHGTQAQVNAAESSVHIFLATDGGETHSTQVLFFGPDNYARVQYVFNDNGEQKQIAHDVPVVLAT
jgi:protein SCO1/2